MADTVYGTLTEDNGEGSSYNPRQQGVFGLYPLATPKYARNVGARDAEFKDTLARLYISIADLSDPDKSKYLSSLPQDAETQALAKVLAGTSAAGGTGYVDFFLQQASEPFQEIMQVDKVLSDDYVAFFYGQQPPVFQYSGTLLNTLQDDQRSGFARAYNTMLRGTQMARRGALARLRYDSVIVTGVMVSHQQALNADNETAVPFSFSFLVKEYVVLSEPVFSRKSPAQFVELSADAAVASLQANSLPNSGPGNPQTTATTVTPATPSATSTAGPDEQASPTLPPPDPTPEGITAAATSAANNVMTGLVNTANALRQSATANNALGNVRGTVDTNGSGAPPAPVSPLQNLKNVLGAALPKIF